MDRRARLGRERKAKQQAAKEALERRKRLEEHLKQAQEEEKDDVIDDVLKPDDKSGGEVSDESEDSSSEDLSNEEEDSSNDNLENHSVPTAQGPQLFDGLLALLPCTKQYEASQAAIKALSNLEAMQQEVVRSSEIMKMVEEGEFDDALNAINEDVNKLGSQQNVSEFNKLKKEAAESGEWEWRPPAHMMRKAKLSEGERFKMEKERRWKRCRRILAGEISLESINQVSEELVLVSILTQGSRTTEKVQDEDHEKHDRICNWTKEDETGRVFICKNHRIEHPFKTFTNAVGIEYPEVMKQCGWHVKECLGAHGDKLVRVKIPNKDGLCNECFVRKHSRPPKQVTAFTAPGAHARLLNDTSSVLPVENGEQLTEKSKCRWKPSGRHQQESGYVCQNFVFRNPETRQLLGVCAWHSEMCVHPAHGKDIDTRGGRILIPNSDGLCVAHYASKHNIPPPTTKFPYPGMILKSKLSMNSHVRHWATPSTPPHPERERPSRPLTTFQLFRNRSCFSVFGLVRRWFTASFRIQCGRLSSRTQHQILKIQRNIRILLAKAELRRRQLRRMATLRHVAAVQLQGLARGFLVRNDKMQEEEKIQSSTQAVIKFLLLLVGRKRRRKARAVNVIQRLGKRKLARLKGKTVKVLEAKRREVAFALQARTVLQRVARGYLARCQVCRVFACQQSQSQSAVTLQRVARAWLASREIRRKRVQSEFQFGAASCIQRLVRRVLVKMYFGQRLVQCRQCAVVIQRIARGYLARRTAKEERDVMELAWNWISQTINKADYFTHLPKSHYVSQIQMPSSASSRPTIEHGDVENCEDPETLRLKKRGCEDFDWSQLELYRRYDKDKTGFVSRLEFSQATKQFFVQNDSLISQKELSMFLTRFDADNDGSVDYLAFLSLASKQRFPCQRHRRFVCLECVTHGACHNLGCSCLAYEPNPKVLGGLICSCSHTQRSHELVPRKNIDNEILDDEAFSPSELRVIFEDREADTFMPIGDLGITIQRSTAKKKKREKPSQQIRPTRDMGERSGGALTSNSSEASSSLESRSVPAFLKRPKRVKNLPKMSDMLVGRKPAHLPSSSKKKTKVDEQEFRTLVRTSHQMASVESVRLLKHDMDEGIENLESVGKTAQSKKDLDDTFVITVPVPLVVNGELRCTTRPSDLYIYLLVNFLDQEKNLIEDKSKFTRVCYRFNVFIERHWKKIVVDVRKGVLNRHLEIPEHQRTAIEKRLRPNPERADLLEEGFRELGFHARASNFQGLAHTESSGQHWSTRRTNPATTRVETQSSTECAGPSPLTLGVETGGKILSKEFSTRRASTPGRIISAETEVYPHPPEPLCKSVGLVATGATTTTVAPMELPQGVEGNSFRRSSHSDVPTTILQTELNRISHSQRLLPKGVPDPVLIQNQRRVKRFVCGHPGCGKTFTQYELARTHEREHALRQRLAVAIPQNDQYLQGTWPSDVPWRKDRKLARSLKADQPFVCPVIGCLFNGSNKESLMHHLRSQHSKLEIQRLVGNVDPDVAFIGGYVMVPPFAAPVRTPMPVCPYHYKNKLRCPMCEDVKAFATIGPMPPLKLFKRVTVRVPQSPFSSETIQRTFSLEEGERMPFVVDQETGVVRHAQLWALVEDCRGHRLMGVSLFYDYDSLKDMGFDVSQLKGLGFDRTKELMQDRKPTWLGVSEIMGTCYTLNIDRTAWTQQRNIDGLPKSVPAEYVRFSRFSFDSKTMKHCGPRLMFPTDSSDPASSIQ